MDVNIFVQVGFMVLVGLAAQDAILVVQFARDRQQEGESLFDAAMEAARERLRPIIMTSFAFILGVFPLVIAEGAGHRDTAPHAGHGGFRRHDRRDEVRPLPDADVLLRRPRSCLPAFAGRQAGRRRCRRAVPGAHEWPHP